MDEIGDLSMNAQTKLLRFLETGEIQKLGTHQTKVVDVRLIFATSRDLESELAKKHFRPDLFYRLNVVRIHIPPLRERLEDIPLLFSFFVQGFCRKFNEEEKLIDAEVFNFLQTYSWPGNVRELRNIAERVVVIAGQRIKKEHLQQLLKISKPSREETSLTGLSFKEFKRQAEKDYIQLTLKKAKGSITQAARLLGMDRTYLHQKITQLDIGKGNEES